MHIKIEINRIYLKDGLKLKYNVNLVFGNKRYSFFKSDNLVFNIYLYSYDLDVKNVALVQLYLFYFIND